jgi:uncharacterized membrane protein YqjE
VLARLGNWFAPAPVVAAICSVAILWGCNADLERYITPQRGLGYALGIVGGSLMLVILVYPTRKRLHALAALGGVPLWFNLHKLLGIVGPLIILFHANFRLGATNSNVALVCMLVVSGSGIVGRYIYSRIYDEFLGRNTTLTELQQRARQLHDNGTEVRVIPDLLQAVDREEQLLLAPPGGPLGRALQPFVVGLRAVLARRRLRRLISAAIDYSAGENAVVAKHAQRLVATTYSYACRRMDAQRRVVEFQLYKGLFSGWHLLHVPLFIMMFLAAIVHVIAVHIY